MIAKYGSTTTMPLPLTRPVETQSLARGAQQAASLEQAAQDAGDAELRATFESVLGEMLFGQMLQGMRKTVGKPAYFHGGRAEEIFTQQLDQVLAENIAKTSADQFVGPMYELFALERK